MAIIRSILAVAAGAVVVVALSTGTDFALEHSVLPQMNTAAVTAPLLFLALVYRTLFGVFAGWVTAKLAPRRGILHAVVLGAIGAVAAGASVFVTWGFGQHWYPIALTLLSVPQTWIGGRLACTTGRDARLTGHRRVSI